jgi:hypothetical protein
MRALALLLRLLLLCAVCAHAAAALAAVHASIGVLKRACAYVPAGHDAPLSPAAGMRERGGRARRVSRALHLLLAACVLLLAASATTSHYAPFVAAQAAPRALPTARAALAVYAVSMRQRMVINGYLENCSPGPCTATTAGKAILNLQYSIIFSMTGAMPPQIATLTAVTRLQLNNLANVSGTLPTQLGLMTLVKEARLSILGKLSGTIPPQIVGMTSLTQLYVEFAGEGIFCDLCV